VPEPQNTFTERFSLAKQASSLGAQGDLVMELMYGLAGRGYWLPDQVGEEMELSSERVRQILRRSLLIIHCLGIRQISLGEADSANAQLLLYLQAAIRPEEGGALERICGLVERELAPLPLHSHALPLVVYLLYGRGKKIRQTLAQLRVLERSRAGTRPSWGDQASSAG
jgi:hypothetical protein